jgi:endoglucanase
LLIVIGGVNYATDLSYLYSDPLDRSTFANRTVWEFHSYQWSESDTSTNCTSYQTNVGDKVGYLLASNKAYTGPLWLSEFGVGMTGGPSNGLSTAEAAYLKCLVQYMEGNDADWAGWALQGSYYTRDGSVDSDETYGLLTHDWSGWRNTAFSGLLGRMWNVTQGP